MVYTLRFFLSSKCSFFHNSNLFDSCIIHILYTGVLKLKKNSGAKRLSYHPAGLAPPRRLQRLVSSEIRYDDCSSAARLT
jgi:hypothetical protein